MATSYTGQEENYRGPGQFEMQKEMDMEVRDDYKESQTSLNKNKLTKLKRGKQRQ